MGRYAEHNTREAALKIDLAEPAMRTAINRYSDGSGVWRWSYAGVETASIAFTWSRLAATLTLRYCCNGAPVTQTLRLTESFPHFGGRRFWFCCPFTGKPVRALYLPAGAKMWGGRAAYKLTYQSQRDSGLERSILRFLARAGSPLAQGERRQQSLYALQEERRWQRRDESSERRNAVRRIARRQRTLARG